MSLSHHAARRCSWISVAMAMVATWGGLGLLGCNANRPTLVVVTGKVVMNGQPLTAGAIYFTPDAANSYQEDQPSSLLELDGSFTMKTFPFGDGVPPGRYKVTLGPALATRISRPNLADPKKTPWELDVPADGLRDHVFEVQ